MLFVFKRMRILILFLKYDLIVHGQVRELQDNNFAQRRADQQQKVLGTSERANYSTKENS